MRERAFDTVTRIRESALSWIDAEDKSMYASRRITPKSDIRSFEKVNPHHILISCHVASVLPKRSHTSGRYSKEDTESVNSGDVFPLLKFHHKIGIIFKHSLMLVVPFIAVTVQ